MSQRVDGLTVQLHLMEMASSDTRLTTLAQMVHSGSSMIMTTFSDIMKPQKNFMPKDILLTHLKTISIMKMNLVSSRLTPLHTNGSTTMMLQAIFAN